MALSTLAWTMTNGAGHGVTITKPENNSVYNNLYNKARVTTEKTTFTFYPVVVHYAGFWFEGAWRYKDDNGDVSLVNHCFSNDALVFRDFLCSENAHYLHGYTFLTGSWDSNTPSTIFNELANKDDTNDIDIIYFVTHGAGIPDPFDKDYGIPLGALKLPDKHPITSLKEWWLEVLSPFNWYSKTTLALVLDRVNLHSQKILLVLDSCHSGTFTDIAGDYSTASDYYTYLPYLTVLASSKANEKSNFVEANEYDKDCELTEKIDNIIQNVFTRVLIRALYYGNDLTVTWEKLGDFDYSSLYKNWYGLIHDDPNTPDIDEAIQHPVRSEITFDEEVYFYAFD